VWEEGTAFVDLQRKQEALAGQKLVLEKKKPKRKGRAGDDEEDETSEEVFRFFSAQLKRVCCLMARIFDVDEEEAYLAEEKERLERSKLQHIRELKRVRDEEGSAFNDMRTLQGRYVLTTLLGKGGFSEVFKVGIAEGGDC
jgi:hypothetical protein